MSTRKRALLLLSFAALLLVTAGGIIPLAAQTTTILTVALPEWIAAALTDDVLDAFEAEHPGVQVETVTQSGDSFYGAAASDLEAHLDGAEALASSADVVYAGLNSISPEATRAGYFLDLRPLADGDSILNADDFYPAALDSYRWDGGLWALPTGISPEVLIYDAAAFDRAGLAYPTESWTWTDVMNAARALTTYDEAGEVSIPGLIVQDVGLLYRALFGGTLQDESSIPATPRFATPELEAFLTELVALVDEGVIATSINNDTYGSIPMSIERTFRLAGIQVMGAETSEANWQAALLPGGTAGVEVEGFAVSAGTTHPELAYELVRFLTSNPNVVSRFFNDRPARRSLVGVQPEQGDGPVMMAVRPTNPEVDALIDAAVENAIPASDLRYAPWLDVALNAMLEDGTDARTALQNAENAAVQAQQTAAQRREAAVIAVATLVPTPVLAADEIALNFQVNSFVSPLPNGDRWESFLNEFAANDPQVGVVNLLSGFTMQDSEPADCTYAPLNALGQMDAASMLALDPFLDADPTFDRSDILGSTTLSQLQRDGRTYGLPIVIQPQVVWYNQRMFEDAGLPLPQPGWTVDEFVSALRTFKSLNSDEDFNPFRGEAFGSSSLLMLMAAFGGLPVDYSTEPPTINLSDPTTVEAVRQVLDLAREGLIAYNALDQGGGMGFTMVIGGAEGNTTDPLVAESLSSLSVYLQNLLTGGADIYGLTTYPRGSSGFPASYTVGAGYISADSLHPDACYRLLSALSRRPDMLDGMPARRSLLDDPTVQANLTSPRDTLLNFYRAYADLLADPSTIVVNTSMFSAAVGTFIEQRWVNRAFDRYVLDDANLDAELAQAQGYIDAYRQCAANITTPPPAANATPADFQTYMEAYQSCATAVDPSLGG
ncbi:MAG: extracellular solute-binding protein [bacterium]|nr:extracellular solute-binding protein [bacterium]